MKKVLFFALAGLLLFGACSKKDDPAETAQKPSISWVGNDYFSTWDIKENVVESDSKVVVTCPEGFATFSITATVPSILRGTALKMIGISDNKKDYANLKFDLIADKTALSNLASIKFLPSANVSSPCTLDFAALVDYLRENIELKKGDDVFTFVINVTDKKENSIEKKAIFKWTAAPEITMNPDTESIEVSMDAEFNNKVSISAPGKIESILVSFSGVADKTDVSLLAYLKKILGEDMALSLLDASDAKVAQKAGFDYNTSVYGQTSAVINLSNFLDSISLQVDGGGTSTEMIFTVTDQLGKVRIETIELVAL